MFRHNLIRFSLASAAVLGPVAAWAHSVAPPTAVTIDSELVDGKLQWKPARITVANGSEVTLTVVNHLKDVEKFEIPNLVDPTEIGAGESKVFTFDATLAGTYALKSSNHPDHGIAKIVILR